MSSTQAETTISPRPRRAPMAPPPETRGPMPQGERLANLAGVVIPFLGLLAAIVLLWNRAVDWIDLAILAVGYFVCAFGVTVGYHRLLTHRSFKTYAWLE